VSASWYEALFDAKPVLDENTDPDFHHTAYMLGNGTIIGLHQQERPRPASSSASAGGLDHVGFGCANRGELEHWARRLDERGVQHGVQHGLQHGGITDASYGSGVSFRDPDGIALEFFAPPG
jgi:catechol 2,3-dioxygenase-like lactoylglutathione lyase family enzyme